MKKVFYYSLFTIALAGCQMKADLIITNAKIWTCDQDLPYAEAVAIRGNRIIKVGNHSETLQFRNRRTKVIDAKGKLLIAGFNDAHLHFLAGGQALLQVDLTGSRTVEEIQRRVGSYAENCKKGTWIIGRGWDQTLFNNGLWPDKAMLDEITPDHPIFLYRVDGHIGWANSVALRSAGIDKMTKSPDSGQIEKDPVTHEPTGILKESAINMMNRFMPSPEKLEKKNALLRGIEQAKRFGITSIQDNSDSTVLELFHDLLKEDRLSVRVSEWLDFSLLRNPEQLLKTRKKLSRFCADEMIRLGLLKGFVDGTMGSRTACFFEPYTDDPSSMGILNYHQEILYELVGRADSLSLPIGLHCIGSKANWMALMSMRNSTDIYKRTDSRYRLEHAQVLRVEDIPLLAELGVIASMQPTHCTSDLRWAEQRIGPERCRGAYAWRSILSHGGKIAFGTDWPVESLDPLRGLYSAVTRRNIETGLPSAGWHSEEKITMAEALRAYTLDAAFAEFQENEKGSISSGKLADMVLLSHDLLSVPEEEILKTSVMMTIFDGKIVYAIDGDY